VRAHDQRAEGFSLAEVLIATAITTGVTAIACALVIAEQTAWRADSARVDLQQRARVAADVLGRSLLEAGAGPQRGPSRGPLLRVIAPVLPRRIGARGAEAPDVFQSSAISLLRAREDAEHGRLVTPVAAGAAALEIAPASVCDLPSCGFSEGQQLLLHDWTGNYDIFTVTDASGSTLAVRPTDGSGIGYAAGSPVVAIESTTFYLERAGGVLRKYDGDATDMPLLDDVVAMEVEYYGSARPPVWPRPSAGSANCLYDADGTYLRALMPMLAGSATLVRLEEGILTDGPWCGAGGNRFDADLLRIRRVRVVLRLQAADPGARGTDRSRFSRSGTASEASSMVSDVMVAVDVAPRNLRQGW
jgi:hypothetical protein